MAAAVDEGVIKQVIYENTYITAPEEDEQFKPHVVKRAVRSLLQERLAGQQYDPVLGSQLVKQLADDVREKVKGLGYDRYKLIVQVTIGEKKGQSFASASRCLWDVSTDGYVSESYQNQTLFCNCQVYGLYFE